METENKERRGCLHQRRKGKAQVFGFYFNCVCDIVEALAELQTLLNTTCSPRETCAQTLQFTAGFRATCKNFPYFCCCLRNITEKYEWETSFVTTFKQHCIGHHPKTIIMHCQKRAAIGRISRSCCTK